MICVSQRQVTLLLLLAISIGCGRTDRASTPEPPKPESALSVNDSEPAQPEKLSHEIIDWAAVEGLPEEIALFNHVFWEPNDTLSLRQLLRTTDLVKGRSVLEIGTGTGIVALCCAQAGAAKVIATDINPWAIRNCMFNAKQLKFDKRIELRQVSQKSPDAWSVIGPKERFDVIVSNPPWEPGSPTRVEDFAFYDPDFQLMKSLVTNLPNHVKPNGRVFLAYGCVTAIRKLQSLTTDHGMTFTVHDDRSLDDLTENFLPGMLIEIHTANAR